MNYTQAAKRVSDMPASVVPDWIKGMALAFEERGVAGNTLIAFVEACEKAKQEAASIGAGSGN